MPQKTKHALPPPLPLHYPFEAAWDQMLEVIRQADLKLLRKNRGQGFILTEFREYISGPLTENHLAKIGNKPKLIDEDWVLVKYQYEIRIELVEPSRTLVTMDANIQALKRNFLGSETWDKVSSNGRLEEDLLTTFGQALLGPDFSLEKGREPTYRPNSEKVPRGVGPERSPL